MACAPALLHASPCRARGPGRYRQPDPFPVGARDRFRRGRRRQFRLGACRHLQGVSRTRRDVRHLRRHQRRLGDGGRLCQKLTRRTISNAAPTRSSSRAAAFAGQPGRATRCWITRRSIARSPSNMASNAGSRIAGGPLPRSPPTSRTHCLELIQSGLVWQAVRASSAIPGLLPPFYTKEGTDAGRRMPDRQCSAGADASTEERPQSGGAFRRARDRDVRRRLCGVARPARTGSRDADPVPQEAAAGSAERGQRAVAKPGGASAL